MTDTSFPVRLNDIADRYDALLCDVWGVMHNGRNLFEPAIEALIKFRETGKPVVLITNAPVPGAIVKSHHFDRLNVPSNCYDTIVSSGDAARFEIERHLPCKIWTMVTESVYESDSTLFKGLDYQEATPENCDLVVAMGLKDYFNDHPEDYRARLSVAAKRGVTLICANPDIQVRIGDQLVWTAGSLARIYEDEGGAVVYPGKPYDPIYELAEARVADLLGRPVNRDRLLAIGDGPETDLKGAMNRDMACLYVGTGLNLAGEGSFESDTAAVMKKFGVTTRYAMPMLRW